MGGNRIRAEELCEFAGMKEMRFQVTSRPTPITPRRVLCASDLSVLQTRFHERVDLMPQQVTEDERGLAKAKGILYYWSHHEERPQYI